MEIKHRIVHEAFHASSDGKAINEYSIGLCEGITEVESREITEEGIISKEFTGRNYEDREDYAANQGIYSLDVLVWDADNEEEPRLYPYMFQADLARKIKKEDPDIYDNLLKCVFKNDPKEAENILAKTYGYEIAEAISSKSTIKFTKIIEMIDKIKENK